MAEKQAGLMKGKAVRNIAGQVRVNGWIFQA